MPRTTTPRSLGIALTSVSFGETRLSFRLGIEIQVRSFCGSSALPQFLWLGRILSHESSQSNPSKFANNLAGLSLPHGLPDIALFTFFFSSQPFFVSNSDQDSRSPSPFFLHPQPLHSFYPPPRPRRPTLPLFKPFQSFSARIRTHGYHRQR